MEKGKVLINDGLVPLLIQVKKQVSERCSESEGDGIEKILLVKLLVFNIKHFSITIFIALFNAGAVIFLSMLAQMGNPPHT
ncbi:hypothetical protein [Radiobacillus deserti]|uniref:Uncharacterized protein n=1 Tax=Radiobacillus deserti TaxID=2594883 RepID=A0A516KJG8_9BACI|nr:hypothetical protein [Radiobacillus deserti]QDP41536.1 hypothetical protein FN924_15955 [Radiobacillus deserti]